MFALAYTYVCPRLQAFHDAGSYDHAAGTGGIDGSIAFETTRSENAGPFLTATINQYRTFQVSQDQERGVRDIYWSSSLALATGFRC